jgi:peptide methionine sulfoxide reductase MsrA
MITNDSELVQRMKLNGIHLSQDKKRLVIVDDIVDNLSVVSSVVNDVYENDTDEECEIKQRKEMNTLENEATIHEVKLDDSLSVVSESDEYPSSIHSKSMYGSSSQYDTVENSDSHSESQATSIEEIKVSFDGQLTQIERLIDQGIDVPAQEKLLKKLKEISEKSSLREGIDTLNQKQNIDNLLVKCQKYKENEKKNVLDELEAVRQFIVAEESNDSKIKIESNQTLIQTLSKTVSPPLNIVDMSGNELKVGSLINVRDESDQEPITYVLKRIVTEWDDQVQSYMLRSTSKDERSLYFVPVSSEIMSVPPDLQIEEIEPGVYGCAAEFVGNGDRF